MSGDAQARARAARNVKAILSGRRSTDWAALAANQSSLSLELTYGCLRHYFSLAAQVDALLSKPLRAKDADIYGLLLTGAYQLRHTRIPAHAALFETVAAADLLGKAWARGLVNAVLRKLVKTVPEVSLEGVREGSPEDHAESIPRTTPEATPAGTPEVARDGTHDPALEGAFEAATEHPAWLQRRLQHQYGEGAAALMRANNTRAPLCLRINTRKIEPRSYRRQLDAAGIEYTDSWLPEALALKAPRRAATLPGFGDGWVAVQDIASQLAVVPLLDRASPGQRLLDACSAPGGKLFRLIEAHRELAVTAIDKSASRLASLGEIAQRLGHEHFEYREGDATVLDWWDGAPFDHVLLDAPCSGTGTLRRHPEIKVLRKPADIARSAALQAALLVNLWRTVRGGGTLLYCTCSILAEENDQVVGPFLGNHRDAQPCRVALPTGRATRYGWQLLPTEPVTDGLYVAVIEKRS